MAFDGASENLTVEMTLDTKKLMNQLSQLKNNMTAQINAMQKSLNNINLNALAKSTKAVQSSFNDALTAVAKLQAKINGIKTNITIKTQAQANTNSNSGTSDILKSLAMGQVVGREIGKSISSSLSTGAKEGVKVAEYFTDSYYKEVDNKFTEYVENIKSKLKDLGVKDPLKHALEYITEPTGPDDDEVIAVRYEKLAGKLKRWAKTTARAIRNIFNAETLGMAENISILGARGGEYRQEPIETEWFERERQSYQENLAFEKRLREAQTKRKSLLENIKNIQKSANATLGTGIVNTEDLNLKEKMTLGYATALDTLKNYASAVKVRLISLGKGFQIAGLYAKYFKASIKVRVTDTIGSIKSLKNKLLGLKDGLESTGDEAKETGDKAKEAGDEAKETGDKAKEAGDEAEKAGDKLKKTGDGANAAASGLKKAKTGLTGFIGTLKKLLPFISIYAIFRAIKSAVTSFVDSVESMNLVNAVFGKQSAEVKKWADSLQDSLGVSSLEMQKTAGTFQNIFKNMGIASNTSLEMSENMAKLSADMASFYNISQEDAFTKLRGGISGETEGLKSLGIMVDTNTLKQYGYSDSLSNADKAMVRYNAIVAQTATANGDLARSIKFVA